VGKPGEPGYQPYVPAVVGTPATPAVPAVPAVPDSITIVVQDTVEMTDAEWNAWSGAADDDAYRTSVVLKRLGLTPAA
jgi:hypothetical protein